MIISGMDEETKAQTHEQRPLEAESWDFFLYIMKISLNEIVNIKSFIIKHCENISSYCNCSYHGIDSLINPRA